MKQNTRPMPTTNSRKPNYSPTNHKTFRYVPRSISQAQHRRVTTPMSNNGNNEERKRITQPRQPPPEPPIPSYLPKKGSPTPRGKSKKKNQGLLLNNSSCIALREHFFDNGDFENYDDEKLNMLLEHLREYSSYSALHRNYDDAERSDKLQERIKEELKMRSSNIPQYQENSVPYEVLLEEKMKEHQKELDEFDCQTEEKREKLEEKQKKDTEEFEDRWRNEMPRKYRKPSTKLITYFEIERKLGLNGNFEKAKKLKVETDRLQAEEMEQAQRLLIKDYNNAKAKFDQQQQEEYQLFIDTRKHWRDVILARHKTEKEAIDNRGNVLSKKQCESVKTKEFQFDPNSRSPTGGGAAIYHRESHRPNGHLLPPLLPPNDEKVKEMLARENEEKRQKNKRILQHIKDKEREADNSEVEFSSSRSESNLNDQDQMLPPPVLKKKSGAKNSRPTSSISSSRNDESARKNSRNSGRSSQNKNISNNQNSSRSSSRSNKLSERKNDFGGSSSKDYAPSQTSATLTNESKVDSTSIDNGSREETPDSNSNVAPAKLENILLNIDNLSSRKENNDTASFQESSKHESNTYSKNDDENKKLSDNYSYSSYSYSSDDENPPNDEKAEDGNNEQSEKGDNTQTFNLTQTDRYKADKKE
ncbi:hypothetical protein TRFO_23561 [Tritrichomonas foetus]|uniref:Uncharacterized protein n=1 Tax=Tritrichomonas foetus TaxID=1144522 RepID=A0A1J4KA56_9EUKA|nr:hypothetical protein TRFO_23561 [Tritrichomonas foetus]|eukprot:OHT08099.1 hypothetical protein TRFO_23561 [Tritrichomonas foetus]